MTCADASRNSDVARILDPIRRQSILALDEHRRPAGAHVRRPDGERLEQSAIKVASNSAPRDLFQQEALESFRVHEPGLALVVSMKQAVIRSERPAKESQRVEEPERKNAVAIELVRRYPPFQAARVPGSSAIAARQHTFQRTDRHCPPGCESKIRS